jgi:sec-independent protein translocase protein TatA
MRGAQLIIIVFVILLLFGGKKIPELMKGLGKGVHAFKEGIEEAKTEMNKPIESEKKPEDKGKDQD